MTPAAAAQLLNTEIVQVVGCTEPAAVAFAFRTLVRSMPGPPPPDAFPLAKLRISMDAFRNASTAVVPRLNRPGVHAAIAAGLASRADDFNVFADFDLARARSFLRRMDRVEIVPVRRRALFVHAEFVRLRTAIVLDGRHDQIRKLVVFGEDQTPTIRPTPPPPSLGEIFDLARARHQRLESIALDFISRQVPAEKGYPLEEQIARRVAGRMAGYAHPVMTLTGSGNQGIFIGLPYRKLHAERGDSILPALVFSLLAQTHLSHRKKRLSEDCGLAQKAAPALAAGLAFARGASPADVRRIFREVPALLANMACEGAEPACGDKARRAFRAVAHHFD